MPSKHNLSEDDAEFVKQEQSSPERGSKRVRTDSPAADEPELDLDQQQEEQDEEEKAEDLEADQRDKDGEDDESMDEKEEDQEEDEPPELTAKQLEERNRLGRIAESGVIESVVLQNFMTHAYMEIKLGPQINLLNGKNGSGKSAILTGISIALGGAAKATNRAAKIGELVKTGTAQNFAIIEVRLKNQGEEAYRPEVYGDSVTVERKLNRDGTGGYKIKNSKGKVVDTTKIALSAMLDHFNIQVDNPFTILTQDESRRFLTASSAKEKYHFVLVATRLAQLTEEYERIMKNVTTMQLLLDGKRSGIGELREAYKRAKARADAATGVMTQYDKLTGLKNQMIWAHVFDMEKKVNGASEARQKADDKVNTILVDLDKFKDHLNAADEQLAVLEEALQETTDNTSEGDREADVIAQGIKDLKAQMKKLMSDERDANTSANLFKDIIAGYDEMMAEYIYIVKAETGRDRRELHASLEKLKELHSKAVAHTQLAIDEAAEADNQKRSAQSDIFDLAKTISITSSNIERLRKRLSLLEKAQDENPLYVYGETMPTLIEAIESETGWVTKPIGPVGSLLELKDSRYRETLDNFLGSTLNAFVVEDEDDRSRLLKIRDELNIDNVPVVLQAFDGTFDCSTGEPQNDILTVRRALSFSNQLVEQVLITAHSIEKIALVTNRAASEKLMKARHPNVDACLSADCYQSSLSDGALNTSVISEHNEVQRLSFDLSTQHENVRLTLQHAEKHLDSLWKEKENLEEKLSKVTAARAEATDRARSKAQRSTDLQMQIYELEEDLEAEIPSSITAIEDLKRDVAGDLESILAQCQAVGATKKDMLAEMETKEARQAELDASDDPHHKSAHKLADLIEAEFVKKFQAEKSIDSREKQLDKEKKAKGKKQETEDKLKADLNGIIAKATETCARPEVDKPKTVAQLNRTISALEKVLKEHERQQGASPEELIAEVAHRRKVAEAAIESCDELDHFISILKKAYYSRLERWVDLRDQITTRAKLQFSYHLAARGFTGRLHFDHHYQKLNIKVSPVGHAKGKDGKTLSGGERSFSTICLLLTLWEAVGCPVRCLDEFDVHLDEPNRYIAIKLLAKAARTSDRTQYVFITPGKIPTSGWGPEVRTHKLRDPERNQGTLRMGTA